MKRYAPMATVLLRLVAVPLFSIGGILCVPNARADTDFPISVDEMAATAAKRFSMLRISNAEVTATCAYPVYRVDGEAALKSSTIELVPDDCLTVLTGRLTREVWGSKFTSEVPLAAGVLESINRAQETYDMDRLRPFTAADYEIRAGVEPGTLKEYRYSRTVEEEGIIGYVRSAREDGTPIDLVYFWKALPNLGMLQIGKEEASQTLRAKSLTPTGEAKLVEVAPGLFVWRYDTPSGVNYVDAKTAGCLSEAGLTRRVQEIAAEREALGEESPGDDYRHVTLAPVFVEQSMAQCQLVPRFANLCGPTSLSMILDYWGETVPHVDIADVCTRLGSENQCHNDGLDYAQDLIRAAMFSHSSTSKWDRLNDGHTGPGYAQRMGETKRYGYTACSTRFDEAYAWEYLTGMIDAHYPFIASIVRYEAGSHVVAVTGYAVYNGCPNVQKYVHLADPLNADLRWTSVALRRWDEPWLNGFSHQWTEAHHRSVVACPIPVNLAFEPFAEAGEEESRFRITATVRTCPKHPLSPTRGWKRVNDLLAGHTLQGTQDGMGQGLPVRVSYPQEQVALLSGNETQYFVPSGRDCETVKEWEFRRDGNEKGAWFKVSATAWAVQSDANLSECQGCLGGAADANTPTLQMNPAEPYHEEKYDPGGTVHCPNVPFLIIVDDEVMNVTAVSEETLTFQVERAQRNTVASAHGAGTSVKLYLMDELFGWASLRIDTKLVRIRNAAGDTIAAFGDQGNVYLAGSVHEWQPVSVLAPEDGTQEFLLTSTLLDQVVGKITASGDLYLSGGYREAMDDVNDSCDVANNADASEQYYLDNPSSAAFMVKSVVGSDTHVVAHIDSSGVPVSSEGEGEGEGEWVCGEGEGEYIDPPPAPPLNCVGGNLRVKGHIFQNWNAWDYWE